MSEKTAVSPRHESVRAKPSGAVRPALTIVLIDIRPWTREAFARALESAGKDLRVVCIGDVADLPRWDNEGDALVLFNMTGLSCADPQVTNAVSAIRSGLPGLPMVALSDRLSIEDILDVIELGMQGYIPISMEVGVVIDALRFVAAGGTFVPADVVLASLGADAPAVMPAAPAGGPAARAPQGADAVTASRLWSMLTARERAVLAVLRQGKSNKHIARELNMCEATVKVHVRHIMRKLGVTNRTEVALIAENFPDV